MARSLKIDISESEEYLEKSRRYARSVCQKEKLQVLWWLTSGQVSRSWGSLEGVICVVFDV